MILGIGTDIVRVERIKASIEKNSGFKELVFSEKEIAYCSHVKNSYESYAARFAAKESFLKALGLGLTLNADLKEIEVINDAAGKPSIILSTPIVETMKQIWPGIGFLIHVSLSHTSDTAMAFLIIESSK
jgi:holo-[acyl-carrier protein] synthase